MTPRCTVFTVVATLLLVRAAVSRSPVVIRGHSQVITSARGFFQSDCVNFITSKDLRISRQIVSTQRRLSDDGIQSAVIDIDNNNNNNLVTSCNRPIYTIFEDEGAKGRLKTISAGDDRLSGRIWLLFLRRGGSSDDLDEYFLDVDIPFDCEFVVVAPPDSEGNVGLTEVYRVAKHLPLTTFPIGSMNRDGFVVWSKSGFYDRRSDLHGIVFKMSVSGWGLFSLIKDARTNRSVAGGFDGIMLDIFEKEMNFKSEQLATWSYGTRMPNRSWTGIMGAILGNEANMSGSPLTITSDRFKEVAFTIPYMNEFVKIYIREPSRNISLKVLVTPFSRKLWVALFVSVVVLSIGLAQYYKVDGEEPMRDVVFQVFCAIFCQQGSPEISRTSSKRLLVFLVYLLGIIVLTSYSCFFISSLTSYTPKLPFTSLKGLVDDGTYSLGFLKSGWLYGEFINAKGDDQNELKPAYDKLVAHHPENVASTAEELLDNICKPKFAVFAEVDTVQSMNYTCNIMSLGNYFSRRNVGLAFPKRSPYIGVFNSKLLKLMSGGITKKHYKDVFYKPAEPDEKPPISASFETVKPILSFGVVAILVSVLVLALEWMEYYLNRMNIVSPSPEEGRNLNPGPGRRQGIKLSGRRMKPHKRNQMVVNWN